MEIQTELLILLLTGFLLSHTIAQATIRTSLSSTIEDVGMYHVCQAPALGMQSSPNVLQFRSALECGRHCSQSAQCRGVTVCPDRGVDAGVVCEIQEVMPNVLCSLENKPDEGCYFMKKDDGQTSSFPTPETGPETTTCQNGGIFDGTRCWCHLPYAGETCHRLMRDCSEAAVEQGYYQTMPGQDGVYDIQPVNSAHSFKVKCQFSEEGVTYVMLRKQELSGSWADYQWADAKNGFGSPHSQPENFFIGLENLHTLTSQGDYYIRVFFKYNNWNSEAYAFMKNFTIGSEASDFQLNFRDFWQEDGADNPFYNSPDPKFSTSDHCYPSDCGAVGGWFGPSGQGFHLLSAVPSWPVGGDGKSLDLIEFGLVRLSDYHAV